MGIYKFIAVQYRLGHLTSDQVWEMTNESRPDGLKITEDEAMKITGQEAEITNND